MSKSKKKLFIEMPLCMSGMGIFRVWTEEIYSNNQVFFPAQQFWWTGFAAFNLISACLLFVYAFNAKHVTPFLAKNGQAY